MRFRHDKLYAGSVLKRPLLSFSSFGLAAAVGLISSLTFSAAFDMARDLLSGGGAQTVSGVWRGDLQDVPAVTIRLEQNGGELTGTARFTQMTATPEGPKASGETKELPLKNVRFNGERLLFEVSNEKEGAAEIVARMEMNFTADAAVAELRRTGGRPEGTPESKAAVIIMRRARSF
jgi:hypothetical protein